MSTPNRSDDDQLGRELGASIRHRVGGGGSAVPDIEVVHRRARRISARRRLAAGAGIGVLALVAVLGAVAWSDRGEPTGLRTYDTSPDSAPNPTNGPTGPTSPGLATGPFTVIRGGSDFVHIDVDGTETVLFHADEGLLAEGIQLADGSVIVGLRTDAETNAGEVLHVRPGEDPVVLGEFADLAGAAIVDGTPVAFVGDVPDWRGGPPPADEQTGDLRSVALGGDHASTVIVEDAYGIEWAVDSVDARGGRLLVASSSEAGQTWTVLDGAGTALDFTMPVDDPDGWGVDGRTDVAAPLLNDEGTGLWWVEVPLSVREDEEGVPVVTGPAVLRSGLLDPENMFGERIEFDLPSLDGWPKLDLRRRGSDLLVNVSHYDPTTGRPVYDTTVLIETFADPVVTHLANAGGPYGFAPTSTAPTAEGPALLVAEGRAVRSYPDGTGLVETRYAVARLLEAGDGSVFTNEAAGTPGDPYRVEVAVYRPGAERRVLDASSVFDIGTVDGTEVVFVEPPAPDGFIFGGIEAWAVDDLRMVARLEPPAEAEFGVLTFDWNDTTQVGVATAWSDLTESVFFVDAAGNRVDLPSPTDDLDYNEPPFVTAATISLDGGTLYWLEGPDWGFDPALGESGPIAAPWVLRAADLTTGAETLVWEVTDTIADRSVVDLVSMTDLGGTLLINRESSDGDTPTPSTPLLLDVTTGGPIASDVPIVGVATPAGS
ncbi:MAG: hypothetical protein R2695_05760 [Acidimicrobiales bacterium]